MRAQAHVGEQTHNLLPPMESGCVPFLLYQTKNHSVVYVNLTLKMNPTKQESQQAKLER